MPPKGFNSLSIDDETEDAIERIMDALDEDVSKAEAASTAIKEYAEEVAA